MRKLILVLGLITGSVSLMQAQTLVPRVGITLATTTVEELTQTNQESKISQQTGYTFGVGYNVPVTALGKIMFSLQPELNYIQKGYKGTTSGEFQIGEPIYQYTGENEFKINYIEIPVLAKFELGSDKIKVAAFVGPSLGFALGGDFKSVSNIDTGEEIVVYKSEGGIVFYRPENGSGDAQFDHNVDFGIQAGAAFTFMNYVTLDVRYGMGLTDLNHGVESKNRVLQFSVGVPIRLK